MTVGPSKATCQTRHRGREDLPPISRVSEILPMDGEKDAARDERETCGG